MESLINDSFIDWGWDGGSTEGWGLNGGMGAHKITFDRHYCTRSSFYFFHCRFIRGCTKTISRPERGGGQRR